MFQQIINSWQYWVLLILYLVHLTRHNPPCAPTQLTDYTDTNVDWIID